MYLVMLKILILIFILVNHKNLNLILMIVSLGQLHLDPFGKWLI